MASGGNPTYNRKTKARINDNKKKQSREQRFYNALAGIDVNRSEKDRNNTSLADLARQYTAQAEANRGQYRLRSLRKFTTAQTRYNSNVRTNEGKIGTIKGVGTTYQKRYTTVTGGKSGAQPTDSGNGNSPPVVAIGKNKLRSTGVSARVQAYLKNRG